MNVNFTSNLYLYIYVCMYAYKRTWKRDWHTLLLLTQLSLSISILSRLSSSTFQRRTIFTGEYARTNATRFCAFHYFILFLFLVFFLLFSLFICCFFLPFFLSFYFFFFLYATTSPSLNVHSRVTKKNLRRHRSR